MATPQSSDIDFERNLEKVITHITDRNRTLSDLPTIPSPTSISRTLTSLPSNLPEKGLGVTSTTTYLLDTLLPGCLQAQNGPRYFGFVTGGVTPAAQLADVLVSSYDENVQVNLHGVTASTAIEARCLELVLDLIGIKREVYEGRSLTTGATASNVLGLACARDYLYANSPHLAKGYSYAQDGPPSIPNLDGPPMIILTLHPHFSILKAASLVGLGSGPRIVHTIPADPDDELAPDLDILEERLKKEKAVGRGVIVCYGLGEVNTGGFGRGLDKVGTLCRDNSAWLHVDAAFGGFAAAVPEFRHLTKGMDMADSLTLDGHKWLNVPYDCGLFFTRKTSSLFSVLAPPAASAPAYLSSGTNTKTTTSRAEGEIDAESVPSPLYVGIENSRRFRALPLLASLMSLGKDGYADIVRRNVVFARRVATYINDSPYYELLNTSPPGLETHAIIPLNIVLFRSSPDSPFPLSDPESSILLTKAINDTRKMYVTSTRWRGVGAIRLAVSNWRTGIDGLEADDEDLEIVKGVLREVGEKSRREIIT